MPAFYTHPATVEDMVNFVVGKVLDAMGIEHNLFKRYGEP
jgi:4-hydroxy-3-polyprenylbenzoate decarboxylase